MERYDLRIYPSTIAELFSSSKIPLIYFQLLASVECLENKVAGDADLNVRIQTSIADLGKARVQIEEILELIQTRITALENKIAEVEQNTNQQMAMVTGEIDALDIKHDSIVTEVNQLKNASTKGTLESLMISLKLEGTGQQRQF